ncbi:MAG: bifunctional nuclease family protein [Thermotogota bacterium]
MKRISKITMGLDKVSNTPVIFLLLEKTHLALPIWIGPCEAGVMAMALKKEIFERPLTHDLYLNSIEKLNYKINKIIITKIENNIYHSTISLTDKNENTIEIDSRPSDAIILGVKSEIPIYLDDDIAINNTVEVDFLGDDDKERNDLKKILDEFNIDNMKDYFNKDDE